MSEDALGLFPASSFRVVTGATAGARTLRQARWYFNGETIAVPLDGMPMAAFDKRMAAFDDVRSWAASRDGESTDYPPLVWIGAPHLMHVARMSDDGSIIDGLSLRLVARLPLNRSYFDERSVAFFAGRPLTVRGTREGNAFELRTVWPDDFTLARRPPLREMRETPVAAMRTLMRETPQGGSRAPFAAWTLWQRDDAADWTGRSVLGLIVNGAQGDDDEAHAGHFAIVTGRTRADGRIGDWLVNNFYTLDAESEKGIIAAPVPLDAYSGDLNSGQSWYRPSYILVLVLRDARAASLVQSALGRVYNQFYRHQLTYYHPDANCTSISVDTLRALGWHIPRRGPTSRWLAWLAFPLMIAKERSLKRAKIAFDYMCTDQTRLLPAAAVEDAYASVHALVSGARCGGILEGMLATDVDAVAFVRVPQFPSSRSFGDAPVTSLQEYRARMPEDPSQLQVVPVPPRPFPEALRDDDLLKPRLHGSDIATRVWGAIAIAGIAALAYRVFRKRR
jgi:hypothetical protein